MRLQASLIPLVYDAYSVKQLWQLYSGQFVISTVVLEIQVLLFPAAQGNLIKALTVLNLIHFLPVCQDGVILTLALDDRTFSMLSMLRMQL